MPSHPRRRYRSRGAASLLHAEVPAHPARFSNIDALHFRASPLLAISACFAAGLLLAHFWRPAAALAVATGLLIALGFTAAMKAPRLLLPAVMLTWTMLGWTCGVLRPPALPSRALLPFEDGLRRMVTGRIVHMEALPPRTAPMPETSGTAEVIERISDEDTSAGGRTWSLDMQLTGVEQITPDRSWMEPVHGGLRLTLYGNAPAMFSCGSVLTVTTRPHAVPEYRDPGVWQRSLYLAGDGIDSIGSAHTADVARISAGQPTLPCRIQQLRSTVEEHTLRFAAWQRQLRLPTWLQWTTQDASQVNAMLLGDRRELDRSLRLSFERTGTFHLFVVAGFHVSVVAGACYALLLWLRAPRWIAALLALLLTAGYSLLTGFGEPAQRALMMTAAYFFARLLFRGRSTLNAVGTAALAMLIFKPAALYDTSFQMTVLIALTIAGICAPFLSRTIGPYAAAARRIDSIRLDRQLPPHLAQFRCVLRRAGSVLASGTISTSRSPFRLLPAMVARGALLLAELTVFSLLTEIVMALPMAVYFHRVTPLALPSNLLVVPLLPVLMVLSIATVLLNLLTPWLALLPGMAAAALIHLSTAIIRGAGVLRSADWRIPSPANTVIIGVLLLFGVVACLLHAKRRAPGTAALLLLPVLFAVVVLPYPVRLHPESLEVTAIDVGQGDSIFVMSPQGETMLVDGGGIVGPEERSRGAAFDTGEDIVSAYLWSRGVRRLDRVVLTHGDMDHLGGLPAVVRNFQPRELWVSADPQSATYRDLLSAASDAGTELKHLREGAPMNMGEVTVRVLSPEPQYQPTAHSANTDSLVLRLDYGSASALLTGDAEAGSERQMLADGELHPVTLLKVGHHGSNTSTTPELLAAIQPRAAVISCGRGNHFGHPRMPILERLGAGAVRTSRTDTMGTVQYLLHRDGSFDTIIQTQNGAGIRRNSGMPAR